ncbi:glycosyltransferase family A protein [Mesoflavibacter sp. CH_XMU1422-2]|uniref:glycosyltransferase family A protein n=1 Tax=Mesoflavibacter sp. CH_XMU1422-2 TaxID=3107770 RepID=UPI00300BE069
MRIGENISKDKLLNIKAYDHRVIIPLFIPSSDGYYQHSFKVFEICINSLNKTLCLPTKISVVSNNSEYSINQRLLEMQNQGLIDELIIEKEPIGKLNSILKVLRNTKERLVTVTDADILFKNNWLKEVLTIMDNFPKAAAVSPLPVFRTQNHYTSNIIFDHFFSKKIKFLPVKNPHALTLFAKSVGWSRLDEKWKDVILTIKNKEQIAVVGCNHCVVTYKTEIFKTIPKQDSKYLLGGDSEGVYLDKPPLAVDGYRLSTYDNYAYHLGNTTEEWMYNILNSLKKETVQLNSLKYKVLKEKPIRNFVKNYVFKKILNKPFVKRFFYKKAGLNPKQLKNFGLS